MSPRTPSNFTAWLVGIGELKVGQTWVLARRTPRILDKYGPDVRCFGKVEYDKLEERYRIEKRTDTLAEIAKRFPPARVPTETIALALTEAFEAGRAAR
jgi:hypothetical protein